MEYLQDIQKPSIERPFGIHLWPIFDKAFEALMGYPASEFQFVEGKTPMSTFRETAIMLIVYYVTIFGGREVMRNRPAFKLNTLFMIHNFVLTAVSAILLALFVEQLVPTIWNHGIFYSICDHRGGWTQPLIVLYYVSVSLRGNRSAANETSSTT
jgi:fatty acid elongase 3